MSKRKQEPRIKNDAGLGFPSAWVGCWKKNGTPSQSAYNAAMEIIETATLIIDYDAATEEVERERITCG
jgi:hypothetical protein